MSKNRMCFMDALNTVACFAVIVLHCTTLVFAPTRTDVWITALLFQSVFIFAVPVFFMVSGANLLNYRDRYSTKMFFKKRLSKVLGSLLFASSVVYVVMCLFPGSFYGGAQFEGIFGLKDFLRRLLTNNICDVYWFMYAIVYLYMLTPLLSKLSSDKKCLEYLIFVNLAVSIALPFINRYFIGETYTATVFNWPLFMSVNLLYFVLGYYVNVYLKAESIRSVYLFLALCLSIAGMFASSLVSNNFFIGGPFEGGAYDGYYAGISSPFCVVSAISLFLLAKKAEGRIRGNGLLSKLFSRISCISLYVYLFHMLLINWFNVNLPSSIRDFFSHFPVLEAVLVFAIVVSTIMVIRLFFRRILAFFRFRLNGKE